MNQFLKFYQKGIKPTFRNFFVILGYFILIGQLIIFFGSPSNFLEEYRPWALLITFLFIIASFIIYWLKSQLKDALINKVRDPCIDIEENLTYRDIEFAIYCLIKKVVYSGFLIALDNPSRFDPVKNIIIGIDRGGAIVGGTLGKMLDLPVATLTVNWAPPMTDGVKNSTETINFSKVERILLVDDAIRKGNTMRKAMDILDNKIKNSESNIQYKRVCIIYEKPWVRPKHKKSNETEEIKPIVPDFFVYPTRHTQIQMPWDLPLQMDYRFLLERYENEFKEFYEKSENACEEVRKLQQSN